MSSARLLWARYIFSVVNSPIPQRYDVLILGAGAAGLMCAIEAGKRGRRVALLERAERPGKKILISGGGRCNFTNIHCASENFISSNPHFAKSALARYAPGDFIALIEKHGIPYHEKTLGQLFCDRSAQDILGMLERECAAAGVQMIMNTRVQGVACGDGFVVRAGECKFRAPVLVVATGGLSIPKIGATLATLWRGNSGLRFAKRVLDWYRLSSMRAIAANMGIWQASPPA